MSNRFQFIDGLRGYAACQVVLLHYCSAFLPVIARVGHTSHYAWEASVSRSAWFVLIDGYSAVYLFFVMSGFVLAPSFMGSAQGGAGLAFKRFTRLYVPVLAASLLAWLLLQLLPQTRTQALGYSLSDWLAGLGHNPLTVLALAKDILLGSMLMGYNGLSVFDAAAHLMPAALAPGPVGAALNTPTWTLHVEFWGSMLVLALALLWRSVDRRLFWAVFASLVLLAGSSHYSLFLLGFLLFHTYSAVSSHIVTKGLGAWLIVVGMFTCVVKDLSLLSVALAALRRITWMDAASDFHWQSQVGAALVFIGVLLNKPAQSWLASPLAQWLGKLSFSIYLLHFPVLLTAGCAVFAWWPGSYAAACLLSALVGIAATLLLATLFEQYVDRPAVAWSRQLTTGMRRLNPRPQ